MLSSRNRDLIPDGDAAVPLENVRRQLQSELQEERFSDQQLVDVWINEEAGAADGTGDAWDECMSRVDQADILIVIYNGNSGWSRDPGGIGICHAELERAWSRSPSKVRLIAMEFASVPKVELVSPAQLAEANPTNKRLAGYIERLGLFRDAASDATSLRAAVRLAVAGAIVELAAVGSREARRGRYEFGSPLDWSRLSYAGRKTAIEDVLTEYLRRSKSGSSSGRGTSIHLGETDVLFEPHGVPSGFGVAEAREQVGRPYLRDHALIDQLRRAKAVGPIHVVACHKSCTEAQLIAFMGHPDLFLVQTQFGYFVADQSSFVQAAFLTNCRDETATRVACQRLFDWIERSGEVTRICARAESRSRILEAMAKEIAQAQMSGTGGSDARRRRSPKARK